MSKRVFIGAFENEPDVVAATRAAHDAGLKIDDVYTPYAVHGLDEAMGLRPSRLSLACLLLGLSGAVFATWFQFWSTAVDWPLNVGGRPWNSLPAFVPVIFELMVLFGGLGTVAVFLVTCRLRPGKRPRLYHQAATNDRFVMVIEESGSRDAPLVRDLLARHHASVIDERELDVEGGR